MERQLTLFDDEQKNRIQKQIDSMQNELNYDTRDFPVSYLVDLYDDEKERIFAPDYQREELLWNPYYKSRFIESLVLDYPIPLIFLGDTDSGKLEIIDGLQRISTIAEFLRGDFALQGLKKLTCLNGLSYQDIPEEEVRRLEAKSLRIIVLKKSTPEVVKKELFDRLNTSSLRATTSEVRYGRESDNPMMKLIRDLSEDMEFRKTTNLTETRLNRKEDIELVSRFFAYSNNLENYSGKVMDFIDQYMISEEDTWTQEKEYKYREEFNRVINFVSQYFDRGFQKEQRNQTPRVRFEALSVGINLALREKPDLITSKESVRRLLESEEFKKWTTTDAANNSKKLESRIYGVRNYFLKGVLE
ncbi:TPA: DUF262 domain-containing protein [Streptococcus agalactiae]|nr:DUF262 domain-containing protein [Streptococcus agalactiae]HEN4303146.1 DUF262 domain-containing protein [Streptococcus agalactiae]